MSNENAAILTAEELAHLRAKPIDELDELDIGVLFDHIGALTVLLSKYLMACKWGNCPCATCVEARAAVGVVPA